MKHRPNVPWAVRTLAAIKHQEGKTNPFIPRHLRERQRPIAEKEKLERQWKSGVCSD